MSITFEEACNKFITARIDESAEDKLIQNPRYRELDQLSFELMEDLLDILDEKQRELLVRLDNTYYEMRILKMRHAYQQGFEDGQTMTVTR